MKVKISEATGPVLDWMAAAANCNRLGGVARAAPAAPYSTDWSQGGPIIEREGINLMFSHPDSSYAQHGVMCIAHRNGKYLEGPTPLIAAMRCFVASRLGDEVDVPEELM